MRHSAVLAAVYAVGALASPVVLKRAYVTEVTWVTVTKYVTPGVPEPTSVAEPPKDEPEEPVAAPVVTPEPTPEQPVEEAPVEEAPVEDTPTETEQPSEPAPEEPAEPAPEQPAEPVPEQPTEPAPEQPTEPAPEQPTEPAPEQPSEPAPEQPTEPAPEQPYIPQPPSSSGYEDQILYHHNVHRANHTAADLTWSADLTAKAYVLAESCEWGHNMNILGGGYGQNLAGSSPDANVTASVSEGWYNNEVGLFEPFYGKKNSWTDEQFHGFGHFTQMVWKDTKEVGCATVDCRGKSMGMHYTVCNYAPPGNVANAYDVNVARPIGNPTVRWNALQ